MFARFTKKERNDLPACPFCGKTSLKEVNNGINNPYDAYMCNGCHAIVPVEYWEKRPIEDALRAELEAWKADADLLGRALDWELNGYPVAEDEDSARKTLREHIALVEKEKSND